jgi:hypothetical protein
MKIEKIKMPAFLTALLLTMWVCFMSPIASQMWYALLGVKP